MRHCIIENSILKVEISNKGAELQSIYNKSTQLEYLWSGDAAFWGKKSPVLFPIVGGLKDGKYEFEEKHYSLSRHGFARDNEFEVIEVDNTTVQFVLKSSLITKQVYPFDFTFTIQYTIDNNILFCTYKVENKDSKKMFFSVGAHPAFAIPLTANTNFDDWFLEFNQNESCGNYPLTIDGLIKTESIPLFNNTKTLPLTKSLFYNDALVFKDLKSTAIKLKSNKTNHGLQMHFKGFSYFGIWSAKDANFICLEPWLGIADSEISGGKLEDKEGIIALPENEIFEVTWNLELF